MPCPAPLTFSLSCVLAATLCVGFAALPPAPVSACTGSQFVARRAQLHCDRKVTYADVAANPIAYVGRVLELQGTVGGTVTTEEGRLTVMLNLPDNGSVVLDVPAADTADVKEFATPQLRVLVEVRDGATGNVVPLKALAMAHESSVSAEERADAARQDALRKKLDWKRREQQRWQTEMDRAMHKRTVAAPVSRGSVARQDLGPVSAVPGGLSSRAQPLFPAYYTFIAHHNPRLSAAQANQIAFHLLNFADRYNVDPRLVVSMIIAESDFDPRSTSHSGAKGLGQLMPDTARGLGVNNPYDVVQNLYGSINYLRSQLDSFAGKSTPGGGYSFEQVALAMAAYNAGENAVKKYHGVPPYRETQAYVKRVISLYQQLCR